MVLRFSLLFLIVINLSAQSLFLNPDNDTDSKFETIGERFQPPAGYSRVAVDSNAFGFYLLNMPLMPEGSAVKDYRGRVRVSVDDSTLAAVVAIDIAGKKLMQCMDILIAMHADYLRQSGQMDQIFYPLPDGLPLPWPEWRMGMRPKFAGLHFFLQKSAATDTSRQNFTRYLNTLFEYTASQTFYHHYQSIAMSQVAVGDFIVRRQKKGHAVMIIDLVKNSSGNMLALIGQGDTPACQLYILKDPKNGPWFPILLNEEYPPLPISKKMYWSGLRRFGKVNE